MSDLAKVGGKVGSRAKDLGKGFGDFLHNYNVLPLAIGVVIGTAANDLVSKIVNGLITPLISLLQPNSNLATWQYSLNGTVFKVGEVLDSLISFVVVALVVYLIAKVILKRQSSEKI